MGCEGVVTERAYCRVYYAIKDDPKFVSIFDNDAHLATWLRLLIAADAIWPASPDLPAKARKSSVAALVDAELVDIGPGGRYRIHGLDAERGARRDAARVSAFGKRTLTERSPNAPRVETHSLTSRSEPSRAEPSLDRAEPTARDSLDRYYELTQYRPWGQWSGDALLGMERDFGVDHVISALDAEHAAGTARNDLLKKTAARLARDAEHAKRAKPTRPHIVKPTVDEKARNEIVAKLMRGETA